MTENAYVNEDNSSEGEAVAQQTAETNFNESDPNQSPYGYANQAGSA